MNLGKLLSGAVRVVERNPKKALLVATIVAPRLVTKLAPKVVSAAAKAKLAKELL